MPRTTQSIPGIVENKAVKATKAKPVAAVLPSAAQRKADEKASAVKAAAKPVPAVIPAKAAKAATAVVPASKAATAAKKKEAVAASKSTPVSAGAVARAAAKIEAAKATAVTTPKVRKTIVTESAKLRSWARAQSIPVASRGMIPRRIRDAFAKLTVKQQSAVLA